MPNPEIEKTTTVYSMVIGDHRFAVDAFYIDQARNGYVVVSKNSMITWIDIAFETIKHKKYYYPFDVWDYSRQGYRTIWNLRLIGKETVKDKDNECIVYFFRYNYTDLEQHVAEALTRNKAEFLTQVPIENFLVDFYIEPKFIIEADGQLHESNEQQKLDQNKDRILRSHGFRIERIRDIREWLALDSDAKELLYHLDTRIKIILAKKDIKSKSEERFQEYVDKEAELRSYIDDEDFED